MRINSVPDVKCFLIIKMCYVHNQWYDISCATLYIKYTYSFILIGTFNRPVTLSHYVLRKSYGKMLPIAKKGVKKYKTY